MTRIRWSIIHRCKYCGHSGIHYSDTSCPYAIGFRAGFNAGREDAVMEMDAKAVDKLIEEVDGNG